jgi:hypothetical protein
MGLGSIPYRGNTMGGFRTSTGKKDLIEGKETWLNRVVSDPMVSIFAIAMGIGLVS